MITAVMSNVAGNGSKFIGTNLAISLLNKKKETKILLLDLDLVNPTLGHIFYECSEKTNNFNIIMHQLYQRNIDKSNISKHIIKTKFGLDVLEGFKLTEIDITDDISQEIYLEFFEILKEMYDEIILVSNIDIHSKLSIMSMRIADQLILVGRNNKSNIEAITRTNDILDTYSNAKRFLLTNMYEREKKQLKALPQLKNYEFIGNITYNKSKYDNKDLIKGQYSKLNLNNRVINKAIDKIFRDGETHE